MSNSKLRNQAGDTIVEVLMSILVLGTVLTGAFVLSQRSSATVQGSQEKAEMNQLLSTQVEMLRAMALQPGNTAIYDNPGSYFCIYTDANGQLTKKLFTPSPASLPTSNITAGTYPSECIKQVGGDNRYFWAVKYDNSPGSNIFTFDGRWNSLSGGISTTTFRYRIQPAN